MAVTSILNPESIVGNRPTRTPEQFQNFISGGSSIGTSVIQSAANKIVGFQRAAVRPVIPDVNSIINSISSNIVNNVDNSIRNATNISNRTTDSKIEQLKTTIANTIQQIKLSAPINEVQNVIENIQQQINQIQNNSTIEQINQTIENIQNQIKQIQYSEPLQKLEITVSEIKNQINEIVSSSPIVQLQNTTNNIQNQINEIESSIQNIQKESEVVKSVDSIGEVNVVVNNIQKQINTIQNKVETIQNEVVQSREVAQSPITQLQTVVQNIQNQISQTFQQKIEDLTKDYKDRVTQVDNARPSGILEKFLDVYKNAIGFVQFFGNKKNIDRLRDNLSALKDSFTSSFEVAKLVRQTILKIVKQLSNLPKATAGGGAGINIDLDVPGGPLRKSAPRGMARRGVGRAGMLGLGLGAMSLGTGAVNALQDSDMVQPLVGQTEIPQALIDKFSAVVDRFNSAIEMLIRGSSQRKKEESGSTSGGSAGGATPTSPSSAPTTGAMPTVSGEGTPEQQAMLKSLRFAEGTSKSYGTIFGGNVVKELEEGKLTVKEVINMADTGKLPQRLGGGAIPGYGSGSKATGAYQFMPGTLENLINKGALDPNELFTPKVQDRAALQLAAWRGVTADVLKKEGFSPRVAQMLSPEWASVPTLSGRSYYGQPVKSLESLQNIYNQSLITNVGVQTGRMGGPSIDPSMLARETRAVIANDISQPARKAAPKVNVLPLDFSGGTEQQKPQQNTQIVAPPKGNSAGPSIPIIPSSNSDNFLVLYSKMVYNVVDG